MPSDYFASIPEGRLRSLVVQIPGFTRQTTSAMSGEEAVERRLRNIDIIEYLSTQRGLSLNAAAGMVANAWAESRLDEGAINKTENAFGLFQLTSRNFDPSTPDDIKKGSKEQRLDPIHNTNYMLWETFSTPYGYWFRTEDAAGAPPPRMAWVFARDLERCASCGQVHYGLNNEGTARILPNPPYNPDGNDFQLRDRARYANLLFPTMTGDDAQAPPGVAITPPPAVSESGKMSWLLLAGVLVAVANVDRIEKFMKGRSS